MVRREAAVRNIGPHPWDTVYEDVAIADRADSATATAPPAEAIVLKAQRAPSHVYQDRSHFVRIMSRLVRYQADASALTAVGFNEN